MKKRINTVYRYFLLGIVLTLFLAACSLAGDLEVLRAQAGGGTFTLTVNTITELNERLPAQKGGTSPDKPGKLIVTFDLGNMVSPASNWYAMLEALEEAGKYVQLDLSNCDMTGSPDSGTTFSPNFAGFIGKNKIISIILPDKATSIAAGTSDSDSAFLYFTNLKTAGGSTITTIGDFAFLNCKSLYSINCPETTIIGQRAFSGCDNLSIMDFKNAITIGDSAFLNCNNLTTVSLLAAKNINVGAFSNSGIININMPSAESIGSLAFGNCKKLTSVTFPKNTNLEYNPFMGCSSLKTFNLPGTGQLNVFNSNNNPALYRGNYYVDAELISWPTVQGAWEVLGIMKIGFYAFLNNTNPITFLFRDVTVIDDFAFDGCTGLSVIEAPNVYLISRCSFYGCTGLTFVDFSNILYIGEQAFGETGDVDLEIKMGINPPVVVGMNIFHGVNVPKNVTVKVPSGSASLYDEDWQNDFIEGIPNITLIIVEEAEL